MENYQDLLALAQRETGLTDFGADTFREGLELLVKDLNTQAQLNAVGEHILRDRILGHLKQRLQIEDWYRRHLDIDDEKIIKPLIGVSLPRTGSTALSFLLAQDPHARSLLRGEAANPCPPPSTIVNDRRELEKDATEAVAGWKAHTPSGDYAPAECQDLMSLDFKSQMFQAFAKIPNYAAWLLDADLTSTYLYQRRALKLLQWGMPHKAWRLKAPTHLIYLEHLNNAFPDARFVMTHRDPTDVMLSVIDVYADIIAKFTDKLDVGYAAEVNIAQWSVGMRRALQFRDDAANNARFFDIHFKSMHDNPVAEVQRLYDWLGEPLTPEFAQGMSHWWGENSTTREPSTTKNPEDYGVDLNKIRPLFAEYTQRMAEWTGRY